MVSGGAASAAPLAQAGACGSRCEQAAAESWCPEALRSPTTWTPAPWLLPRSNRSGSAASVLHYEVLPGVGAARDLPLTCRFLSSAAPCWSAGPSGGPAFAWPLLPGVAELRPGGSSALSDLPGPARALSENKAPGTVAQQVSVFFSLSFH